MLYVDQPTGHSATPSGSADRGLSLVEVLVTIVLLGIGGVAVLGAMAAAAHGSAVNKSQAGAIVWLQSAADYMATTAWASCTAGTEASVTAAYDAQLHLAAAPQSQTGSDSTISVASPVQFWNGTAFSTTCTLNTKLEQITLQVTRGAYTHSLVIVKSNV